MARQKATIRDVAKACNVSLSTVSLVLNGNPRISQATRDRVLDAVRAQGYVPNAHARGLVSRSSHVLSVAVPALRRGFASYDFGDMLSGIYDRASEAGYKMLLDIANEQFVQTREYLSILQTRQADGMLFIASSMSDTYLTELEREEAPFLLVDHYFPGSALHYLSVDYRACARLAARHLLGLGHRSIGLIAGTDTYTGRDFRDAFLAACRGAAPGEVNVPWVAGEWNQDGGYRAAQGLVEQNPGLTAVMGASAHLAIGAMRCLRTRGARVPEDISVMGMGDVPDARSCTPELTTIRFDRYQLGRLACTRLLEMINGKRDECRELVPADLVVRASTGRAPG